VDWAASEIPYGVQDGNNYDPPPTRGLAYMPDTAGAVAFMYNLTIGGQRVTNLRLSGAVIAGIFTDGITNLFVGSGIAAGQVISGSQLGWTPGSTWLAAGVTLGAPVAPAGPGLVLPVVLAQAQPGGGSGTSVLGADLTLAIPPSAAAGPYTGALTLTAVTSLL
jgi:hypothetical protein